MHELSLCRRLLKEVARVAAAHDAGRVTRLTVSIGPLSGVEAPLLERAFAIARQNTVAKHAVLVTEIAPIRVSCRNCEKESDTAANNLRCRNCGDWHVRLLSGDALLLKGVEMEAETDAVDGLAAIA